MAQHHETQTGLLSHLPGVAWRSGRPAGYVEITELGNEHVTVSGLSGVIWEEGVVRPGTCRRPGRGESIHIDGSTEADVDIDDLLSSTFAVEAMSACAEHLGGHDLRTADVEGRWSSDGHVTRTATKVFFKGFRYWLTLTPGRGPRTRVVFTIAGSSRVGRGRELPLRVGGGKDGQVGSSTSVTIVGVPFAEFLHRRWVLELDEEFGYRATEGFCVQL